MPIRFLTRLSLSLVALSFFLGISPVSLGEPLAPLTNPTTALAQYVRAPDEHYRYEITDVERGLLTRYTIRMRRRGTRVLCAGP